jgi:hydroxymethylpyrimidine pyrophosphatase-like HAD family hydrolase
MKIIAIDFDGTIAEYDTFKGKGIFGKPIKGAREAIFEIKKLGYEIMIYTTRKEIDLIGKYLIKYGIPVDYINENPQNTERDLSPAKMIAEMYIDDRGIKFNGDWEKTLRDVKEFKRWYRK